MKLEALQGSLGNCVSKFWPVTIGFCGSPWSGSGGREGRSLGEEILSDTLKRLSEESTKSGEAAVS